MVEDTPLVRSAVKRMLTSLGYKVIDASTGPEALAVLQSDEAIDLLFTDMILPGGLGGNELALTAQSLRPDIRILLTSGYTQTQALPTAPDGSTNLPLIAKPYTKAELAERLAQIFGLPPD
jgi:CheY-like chemotaxis protein